MTKRKISNNLKRLGGLPVLAHTTGKSKPMIFSSPLLFLGEGQGGEGKCVSIRGTEEFAPADSRAICSRYMFDLIRLRG